MTFQASDLRGSQFLDLVNDDNNLIKPSYINSGSWLKHFRHSNSLCIRAIVNHTPIGEYRLRFFPREEFKCLYSLYPIKSRHHILQEYRKFNKY